jgi:hypothetical protein
MRETPQRRLHSEEAELVAYRLAERRPLISLEHDSQQIGEEDLVVQTGLDT